jgi:flagellar hook-associated protein 2
MSTSATSTTNYFNGESTFATDLNNVISRAVSTATLPITLLQNEQSTLTNQQSEVQTLGSDFEAVQSAIDSLNTAVSASSYSASVDTPSVASATASSGALPGTYALDVSSIGSQTNTISSAGSSAISDPSTQGISTATSYTLSVGSQTYTLSPSGTSLNSLVAAINSSGANVQATVINVGGSASPDYRLSVQGTEYAPDTVQLSDGTNNLLTSLNTGSYVTYQVNGEPATPINSTSRSLSLSTGLTADVTATGTANITVSQSNSAISTALSSFVTAYNAAVDEVTKNRGQGGGALTGDSLISQLESALDAIGSYSSASSGSVSSLADLGITFDENGHLDLDQTTLNSALSSSSADVLSFLGSETGSGFIQSAYSSLTSLTDSTYGSITETGNSIGTSISNLTTEISNKQAQVTQLQTNLTTQMAAADAAISALQGQDTEITDLFSAEQQESKDITG